MKMTPVEIKRQEFSKSLRGYKPEEVRSFLDSMASEIEETIEEQRALKEKTIDLDAQLKSYKNIERAMQETLMQAQESSAKSIENARQEARLLLKDAELKASQMLEGARNNLSVLKEQITILKARKDSIVSRLRMLLNSELELIKALEVDEELQTGQSTERQETSKEKLEIEEIIKGLDQ